MDDPRGLVGELLRGKNVYNGGSNAAHSGGGLQFGRPKKTPIKMALPDTLQNAVRRRLAAQRGTI